MVGARAALGSSVSDIRWLMDGDRWRSLPPAMFDWRARRK
jgi:hypothetical protein